MHLLIRNFQVINQVGAANMVSEPPSRDAQARVWHVSPALPLLRAGSDVQLRRLCDRPLRDVALRPQLLRRTRRKLRQSANTAPTPRQHARCAPCAVEAAERVHLLRNLQYRTGKVRRPRATTARGDGTDSAPAPHSLPGSTAERDLLRSFSRMLPEILRFSSSHDLVANADEELRNCHRPVRENAAPAPVQRDAPQGGVFEGWGLVSDAATADAFAMLNGLSSLASVDGFAPAAPQPTAQSSGIGNQLNGVVALPRKKRHSRHA